MHKIQALATVAALTLAGGALAQAQGRSAGPDLGAKPSINMSKADENADGRISRSEAAADPRLAKKFDSIDADRDGSLSSAEFAQFEAEGAADSRSGMGGDSDGVGRVQDKRIPGR